MMSPALLYHINFFRRDGDLAKYSRERTQASVFHWLLALVACFATPGAAAGADASGLRKCFPPGVERLCFCPLGLRGGFEGESLTYWIFSLLMLVVFEIGKSTGR